MAQRLGWRLVALLLALAGAAWAEPGRLVIAGGGVAADNAAVHGAFLAALDPAKGGNSAGRIAVIAAATAEPAQSAAAYAQALARHGVAPERIEVIRLAAFDDETTPDINEASWANNAESAAETAKVATAAGVWFTGGDQARITRLLRRADGQDTSMLAAIRAGLAAGGAVGGTSAGAAVMGPAMIARGESLAALIGPVRAGDPETAPEDGALMLAPGLGLFPDGVVDQHFGERARLGRLARALAEQAPEMGLGFGIDEDTALVADLAARALTVVGAGHVTVLDARGARFSERRGALRAEGMILSSLAPGDRATLPDLQLTPDPRRTRIAPGAEYFDAPAPNAQGMAAPEPALPDALGRWLIDTSAPDPFERISFTSSGAGVRYVFAKTAESWGAYGRNEAGRGRYTIARIAFAIIPVRVRITDR